MEFSFRLGPADGRYLARGRSDDLDVICFRTLDAPRRTLRRGRRPKRDTNGEAGPQPVPVSRAMVIGATGFDGAADAASWLERSRSSEQEREQLVAEALRVVNDAIRAHRVSAADPYVREVARSHAHRARIGYGIGDDLVEGRWAEAYAIPVPRGSRRQALEPQQELAAVLSGRRTAYASEDLALRAHLDLDHQRVGQAALQLDAALGALEAELEAKSAGGLSELARRRPRIRELAAAALRGPLDEAQADELAQTLTELERALRRRRHRHAG